MNSSRPIYWINRAEFSGGKVVLYVNGTLPIVGRLSFAFLFAPAVLLPEGADNETQVVLNVNDTEYTTWDMFGMNLTLGEIPTFTNAAGVYFATRRPMVTGLGSNGGAYRFVVWNLPTAQRRN